MAMGYKYNYIHKESIGDMHQMETVRGMKRLGVGKRVRFVRIMQQLN